MCLPIQIGHQENIALWDTGAKLSNISEWMCRELNITTYKNRDKTTATSVCKENIHFKGQATITFSIANKQFTHEFHVWTESPFDCILGTDFMTKCGPVAIDHKNKLFWFDGQPQQAISVISKPKKFKHIPVALINDITVPPRSACHMPVQCNCPVTLTNTDVDLTEMIISRQRNALLYRM